MAGDDITKLTQGATSGLGEVVKLAKESPEAREAGQYAAKSLAIIMRTVHTVLLPIAAANYGAERFAAYMRERFAPELAEALADVPEENIQAPRPTIAGPVLDSLVYAHEDDDVRRLYLALLATAMDKGASGKEHPAFVEVLRQIDVAELPFVRAILQGASHRAASTWPIARIEAESHTGLMPMVEDLLDWRKDGKPVGYEMAAAYVSNWVRLGLVTVTYPEELLVKGGYAWVTDRPEYRGLAFLESKSDTDADGYWTRRVVAGALRLTDWGIAFAKAVKIDDAPTGSPIVELARARPLQSTRDEPMPGPFPYQGETVSPDVGTVEGDS